MTTKKIINRVCAIAIIIVATVVIYFVVEGYSIKYDIENHGKFTVGKYVSQDNCEFCSKYTFTFRKKFYL